MNEKDFYQRLALIGVIIVVGLVAVFPMHKRLQPGLDIAGGVAMIYEIEKTPDDPPDLAEQMKTLLAKRVDPRSVYNLTWRVMGSNRIEVQMPLPPKGAQERRNAFDDAFRALFKDSLTRGSLQVILALSGDERDKAIVSLANGVPPGTALPPTPPEAQQAIAAREAKLRYAARKFDEYESARKNYEAMQRPTTEPTTAPASLEQLRIAMRDASEEFDGAIEDVLADQLEPQRFREALDLADASRDKVIKELELKYPALASRIEDALGKYKLWQKDRGYLESGQDLQRLLRGAGVLEFRILAEPTPENITKYDRYRKQLQTRGASGTADDEYVWFRIDNPIQFFNLETAKQLETVRPPIHDRFVIEKKGNDFYVLSWLKKGLLHTKGQSWQLKRAGVSRDEQGRPEVIFALDVRGGALFGDLTSQNIGKQLCIIVDNVAYSSATIQSKITDSGRITGDFSMDKVNYLVQTMQAGALPARLKETPVSERTIGSSLGESNRDSALRAGLIGSALVFLMIVSYYLKTGGIAMFAVALNVLLTLAMMSILGAKITLDGIAGLVLSVGMAVDANVLINERMREEKERGASLRVCVKNGYDRAWSAILDGHITTLLTSLIIYYVGSQEIRGFGLMLGWGIVLSLFTSVFVTRTLLELLIRLGWEKQISMLKLIRTPSINWYGWRKVYFGGAIAFTVLAVGLVALRPTRDYFDVEFLGGTSATIEMKKAGLTDPEISAKLQTTAREIGSQSQQLASATIEPIAGMDQHFAVRAEGISAARLAAMLTEPLEDANLIRRNGVQRDASGKFVSVHAESEVTPEQLRSFVQAQAPIVAKEAKEVEDATIASVLESGAQEVKGLYWEITTTATNKRLVQDAIAEALGDQLRIQQRIQYVLHLDGDHPFPIKDRRLEAVVPPKLLPAGASADLSAHVGGAAIFMDQLNPPQPVDELRTRLKNMRLQPGHEDLPWRDPSVIGLAQAGVVDGKPAYSSVLIVVADKDFWYEDNPTRWAQDFADKELALAKTSFETEQPLRKVSQFKPQVAAQAQQQAIMAIALSWVMIIVFLWIRFGKPMYGVASVVGLIHTVLIAFAFVGLAGWAATSWPDAVSWLLIENFKFNMPVLAALLTLIGYAVNDTIVVFDRIRELRGRLGIVTPEVINRSINECMSRTILTGSSVLLVLLAMYIFGGSSIRGFNFAMFIGVIAGTYSSIAIATPLLLLRADRPDEATPRPLARSAPAPAKTR